MTALNLDSTLSTFKNVGRVRVHVQQLFTNYPSLRPKEDTLVMNDGTSMSALCLFGALPIVFRGRPYGIPVEVFLLMNYPETPPIVYVRPIGDMEIVPHHRYVDRSGLCSCPAISTWSPAIGDVVVVLRDLQVIFGDASPLFERQKNTTSPMSSAAVSSSASANTITVTTATRAPVQIVSKTTKRLPPAPTLSAPVPEPTNFNVPTPTIGAETSSTGSGADNKSAAAARAPTLDAMETLRAMTFAKLKETLPPLQAECTNANMMEQKLREGSFVLSSQIETLNVEKAQLVSADEELQQKRNIVEQWLKHVDDLAIGPEEVFQPVDPESEFYLSYVAEDAALDDCLYYLQQALYAKRCDFDTCVRLVRQLARREGEIRASLLDAMAKSRDAVSLRNG